MTFNRLTLIGFLGQDAEKRFTTSGTPYTVLSLATKTSWKDHNGDWQNRTEWHPASLLYWQDHSSRGGRAVDCEDYQLIVGSDAGGHCHVDLEESWRNRARKGNRCVLTAN